MAPVTFKNPAASTSVVKKRKKPPACDYCKGRRVICHPQPNGKPCPRCVEKEIKCTTTPVVRRKPTKRPIAQAAVDPTPSAAPATSSASSSHDGNKEQPDNDAPPASQPAKPDSSSSEAILSWRDAHPLPATLIEELIKLFPSVPQSQLPIVPYRKICDQLEACGWDPSQLHPHSCVLAYSIMAVTAHVSTHPMLIGADVTDTQLLQFLASGNVMITPGLDLREFGRRRDAFCRRLQDEACRLAFEAGVTAVTSQETAASCYLLDFLESSTNPNDNPMTWTAAMMWHIRTLAESEDRGELFSASCRRLQWPIQLMHCALLSLCSGRSLPFTEHDERLICGPPPQDIEAATITLANQPVTGQTIAAFIYPFLSHVIHLARQSSENIIGPYARRLPLNVAAIISHIAAVEALQKTCVFLHDCIEFAMPKAKRDWARPALANGLFVTGLAAPCLLVPLHRELRRRCEQGSVHGPYGGADGFDDHFFNTTTRAQSRIESLHRRVRFMAMHAVSEVTKRAPRLPSLAYMTHVHCSRFEAWAQLFVSECEPSDMPPLERYLTLERIAAIIKLDGFAWIDRSGSLSAVEDEMAHLQRQQQLESPFTHDHVWDDVMERNGTYDELFYSGVRPSQLGDSGNHDVDFADAWLSLSKHNILPARGASSFSASEASFAGPSENEQFTLSNFEVPLNFGLF
ncbi:hypothetical protein HDZ31DRAFT_29208 [Schizophyllum fasciatum]